MFFQQVASLIVLKLNFLQNNTLATNTTHNMPADQPKQALNSTPEILLKKRRNADRTRLEKQELAQKKKELENKRKYAKHSDSRFVRAETIVATTLATSREKERIKRISKLEHKKSKNQISHLPSNVDFILKITEPATNSNEEDQDEDAVTLSQEDDEAAGENEGLVKEKVRYNGEDMLIFVIRVKGPTTAKIPKKPFTVLKLLRLLELNTGVFMKLTKTTFPLLKLVSPYVIIGQPSLNSIRSLIQKRSRILYQREGEAEPKEIILNDNNIVEEKLGGDNIICIEDIIHEISSLGENFNKCNFFLQPFRLNREVSGFSAVNKLMKLKLKEHYSKFLQNSNSSTAPVIEVDIDAFISKLN